MKEKLLRVWVRSILQEQIDNCEILYDSHAAVGRRLAAALGGTLQQHKPVGDSRSFRIIFDSSAPLPSEADMLQVVRDTLNCADVTGFPRGFDSVHSGKYPVGKYVLPAGPHPSQIGVVLIHKDVKRAKGGGTPGPGEMELVDGIETIGAAEDAPITVVLGGTVFKGVTGVVMPERGDAVGGEPKIDVMLLGAGGKGHPAGAFSLKGAGGAPTYGGWSRIGSQLGAVAAGELEAFIDDYIDLRNPPEIAPGVYDYVGGNFSKPASDAIADFALYGNSETSGGKKWGKEKVDHLVTVNSTNFEISPDGTTITFPGYSVAPAGDLLRGTDWEPYFLMRGATDGRKSGPRGKKVMGRLAITNAKRAKQYSE